jgi:predicted AAA+ superfamily ATPase
MITRKLTKIIKNKLNKGKIIVLLGARQVGKTTLLKTIFKNSKDFLWINGDEFDMQTLFANASVTRLKNTFAKNKVVVIDEAQRIKDIGLKLKLISDDLKNIQIIATGSSSFDLVNKVNEPLTGRKWEYKIYPFSFGEMVEYHGLIEEKRLLSERLIYGYYPEIVNNPGEEKERLKLLSDSYLYKDILAFESIQKPEKLIKILQALSFQIGSQVSYCEIGQMCGLDVKTVEKYIILLEQCYVIFRLGSFSRNLRNELKHSKKIYFYDNGIRNSIIADFSIAEKRSDIGALWENFLISERRKKLEYEQLWKNTYFWRTVEQKEIDYIEESDGIIEAFEFKWNPDKKYKIPKQFSNHYKGTITIVTPDNASDFLL